MPLKAADPRFEPAIRRGPYFRNPDQMGRTYDVSPDGQRFLMVKVGGVSDETAAPTSITVVQNWLEKLKRLVPTKR